MGTMNNPEVVLSVRNMVKDFPVGQSSSKNSFMRAVNDVSFDLCKGEALAIVGESGSGKSEVAHMVSKILKNSRIYAKVLHTDNYYKIHPVKRGEWRKKHGIESIGVSELDWNTIQQNIKDFKENKRSKMPCIDLLTDQIDVLETDFSSIPVLILDGLYCLKADVDLKIMIDLTYNETKKAQISRGKEKLIGSDRRRRQLLVGRGGEPAQATKRADSSLRRDG